MIDKGQPVRQLSGGGVLRVDAERGVQPKDEVKVVGTRRVPLSFRDGTRRVPTTLKFHKHHTNPAMYQRFLTLVAVLLLPGFASAALPLRRSSFNGRPPGPG